MSHIEARPEWVQEVGRQTIEWVSAREVLESNSGLPEYEVEAAWMAVHSLRVGIVRSSLNEAITSRIAEAESEIVALKVDVQSGKIAQQILSVFRAAPDRDIMPSVLRDRDFTHIPSSSLEIGFLDRANLRSSNPDYKRFRDKVMELTGCESTMAGRVSMSLLRTRELRSNYFESKQDESGSTTLFFKGTSDVVPTKDDLFKYQRNVGDELLKEILTVFWALGKQQQAT